MLIYKCDNKNCEKEQTTPLKIHLKGYVGYSGGILLPDYLKEFEFCCDECFLNWVKAASSCELYDKDLQWKSNDKNR